MSGLEQVSYVGEQVPLHCYADEEIGDELAPHRPPSTQSAVERLASIIPAPDPSTGLEDRIAELVVSSDDLLALPPAEPLVTDFLYRSSIGMLFGPAGCGKSFVGMDLSICIAIGQHWQGREVIRSPVIYVAGEGKAGIGRRIESWKAHHNYHGSLDGLHWIPAAVNIADVSTVTALANVIGGMSDDPPLIVFDTFARCAIGTEENSARDVGLVVNNLDRLRESCNATILLVHHSGKDAGAGARGSSALRAAVDTELELTGSPDRLTLRVSKQKDGAEAPPLHLALEHVPGTDSVVVVPASEASTGELPTAVATTLAALMDVDVPEGVSASTWRLVADAPERTFYRHRKGLLDHGLVANVGTDKQPRYRPVVGDE